MCRAMLELFSCCLLLLTAAAYICFFIQNKKVNTAGCFVCFFLSFYLYKRYKERKKETYNKYTSIKLVAF